MKLEIWYSIENGGDGSAYPCFFESEKLAEWHQDHLSEGWGEPCTGSITIEGDNLSCVDITTKEQHYLEHFFDYDPTYPQGNELLELHDFVVAFFPAGLPNFRADFIPDEPVYYGVYLEGELIYKTIAYPEEEANQKGLEAVRKRLAAGL